MKQVDKRPTEGKFLAVWEYNGAPYSETYEVIDGVEYRYDWHGHNLKTIDGLALEAKYFIAEPALKEITFKEDYELLKWLKDNAGEYLYSDETKSVKAHWSDASTRNEYRVMSNMDVIPLLITNYLQQKTWYHY